MRDCTHWGLGVFDIFHRTARVYDSFAHLYGYSPHRLQNGEPALARMWGQITNLPLLCISVADSNQVHRQIDGVNCGVFTCIYAERLLHGLPTRSEEPTRDFLLFARRRIDHCLRGSFLVSDVETDESAPLPRIFQHFMEVSHSLHFANNTTHSSLNQCVNMLSRPTQYRLIPT